MKAAGSAADLKKAQSWRSRRASVPAMASGLGPAGAPEELAACSDSSTS